MKLALPTSQQKPRKPHSPQMQLSLGEDCALTTLYLMHPQAHYGPNCESKGEDNGRRRSWGALFNSQHFKGRGVCWSFGMGLGRMTSNQSLTRTCTNQTTSWLMHSQSTFGARMNHEQTQIHETQHGPNLGEATTFPLIVYFVNGHKTNTQMSFCPRTPKWESRNSQNKDSCNFGGP